MQGDRPARPARIAGAGGLEGALGGANVATTAGGSTREYYAEHAWYFDPARCGLDPAGGLGCPPGPSQRSDARRRPSPCTPGTGSPGRRVPPTSWSSGRPADEFGTAALSGPSKPRRPRMKTIATVIGTRPEAVKMAPIVLRLAQIRGPLPVCVTGQHREMLDQVLDALRHRARHRPRPHDARARRSPSSPRGSLGGLDAVLEATQPDVRRWCRATRRRSSAAALAAFYRRIPVAHVEAGLRTGDIRSPFPEEMNRAPRQPRSPTCTSPRPRPRATTCSARASTRDDVARHRQHGHRRPPRAIARPSAPGRRLARPAGWTPTGAPAGPRHRPPPRELRRAARRTSARRSRDLAGRYPRPRRSSTRSTPTRTCRGRRPSRCSAASTERAPVTEPLDYRSSSA